MALSDAVNADANFQTLSQRLKQIWDDVGATYAERNQTWSEIEQCCQDVYKKVIDQASKLIAHPFRVMLADATYPTLLQKLKEIRFRDGELVDEGKNMLCQIEKECVGVFKKKVDEVAESKEELIKLVDRLEMILRQHGRRVPKLPGTLQNQLDCLTMQLVEIEEETGQKFVIDFEPQPNELQEKEQQAALLSNMNDESTQELADGPTVSENDLTAKMIDEFDPKLQVNTRDQYVPVSM